MSFSLQLASAVSVGTAAGVFLDPDWTGFARWVVGMAVLVSFVAGARARRRVGLYSLLIGGTAVCTLLGADAQHRAIYPPLRVLLERQVGGFAIETIGLERHDGPFEIEGRLTADAAITDAGANLRLRIERVWLESCPQPTSGGVSVTVVGVLAAEAATEWRSGRILRMPVALRRPARYLNDGVADEELVLARRGIALVGSVKSATLVHVVRRGPWYDEWASAVRASVRRALRTHAMA